MSDISDYSISDFIEHYGKVNVIKEFYVDDFIEHFELKDILKEIDPDDMYDYINLEDYLEHEYDIIRRNPTIVLQHVTDDDVKYHFGTDLIQLYDIDEILDNTDHGKLIQYMNMYDVIEHLFDYNSSIDSNHDLKEMLFSNYIDTDDILKFVDLELILDSLFSSIYLHITKHVPSNKYHNSQQWLKQLLFDIQPDFERKLTVDDNLLYNYVYLSSVIFQFVLKRSTEFIAPHFPFNKVNKDDFSLQAFDMDNYNKMYKDILELLCDNVETITNHVPNMISQMATTVSASPEMYPKFFDLDTRITNCTNILNVYESFLNDMGDE